MQSRQSIRHSFNLDRRQLLLGSAALAGAAALPGSVLASAAPPYTFKQGDFEVTVVSDGELILPVSVVAPEAPQVEVLELIASMGQGPDEVRPETNALLIRSGSELVLVDTGAGSNFGPTAGRLPDTLKAAGIDPATITKVVFTHAHADHIGGTTVASDQLRYPNATYYIGAVEHDFWMDPGLMSRMPTEMQGLVTVAQSNLTAMKEQLTLLKNGGEIVSGVRVLDTPGHTPGHMSVEIAGGDGLIIVGDAITSPIFFIHPEWRFGFDADGAAATASRRAILDRAAADRTKLLGYHWPYPGVGSAERKDNAYRYVAS
jgi:glyoxylase-like metal-dependent hydrolase (beta-lactamase superfamily II)